MNCFFLILISAKRECMSKTNETTTTTKTTKEGDWQGCVVGMYPENGNETLPSGDQQEIDDFEAIIKHEVGSVVWFPTGMTNFQSKRVKVFIVEESSLISPGSYSGLQLTQIIAPKQALMATMVSMMYSMENMMNISIVLPRVQKHSMSGY